MLSSAASLWLASCCAFRSVSRAFKPYLASPCNSRIRFLTVLTPSKLLGFQLVREAFCLSSEAVSSPFASRKAGVDAICHLHNSTCLAHPSQTRVVVLAYQLENMKVVWWQTLGHGKRRPQALTRTAVLLAAASRAVVIAVHASLSAKRICRLCVSSIR